MKVGLLTYYTYDPHESLAHVRSTTAQALARDHDLVPYPKDYPFASPPRQRELLKEWLCGCDVVVGSLDGSFLEARQDISRPIPYICLLLGQMSRGASGMIWAHERLNTYDVLVGNCHADVALTKKFFPNSTTYCLPFAYDESAYYPVDRHAARAKLGIDDDSPLFVYAGRITLEKNLHTLLKAFRIVANVSPQAKLLIAGAEVSAPFREFGVFPLGIRRTLERLIAHLKFNDDQVLFAGNQTANQLREIYNAADALVNLTLHHDENFGLVQVEAMACGLPTIGSAWGGLRDTILPGVTGEHIRAVITPIGVKVDWWQAANKMISLLARTPHNQKLRQQCVDRAREHYSMERYQTSLTGLLCHSVRLASEKPQPVCASKFARDYWGTFVANSDAGHLNNGKASHQQGSESWNFYRDLVSLFAAPEQEGHQSRKRLGWCLAAPLKMQQGNSVVVNDPIYPFEVEAPLYLAGPVRCLINQFSDQPVIDSAAFRGAERDVASGLIWMHDTGLLIRTEIDGCDVRLANGALGKPVFAIKAVDQETDVVCFV